MELGTNKQKSVKENCKELNVMLKLISLSKKRINLFANLTLDKLRSSYQIVYHLPNRASSYIHRARYIHIYITRKLVSIYCLLTINVAEILQEFTENICPSLKPASNYTTQVYD